MDKPSKKSSILLGSVGLAAVIGMNLVEFFANRPKSFVPIAAAGRVCAAYHWGWPRAYWFYYTTPAACDLSWGFAIVLATACLIKLANR